MAERFRPVRAFTVATYNGLKLQYVASTPNEAMERACEDLVCEWNEAVRALEATVVPVIIAEDSGNG